MDEPARNEERRKAANAEVANRVLLWGIASVAAVLSTLCGVMGVGIHDPSLRYTLQITQSAAPWACAVDVARLLSPGGVPAAVRRAARHRGERALTRP